jgi:prepilin-type processing-associated H-X9-DG protein
MSRCRFGLVALTLLSLAGGSHADEPKTGDLPPELSWVPADAAGFLQVRFGELWNGPLGPGVRDALNRDDAGAIERVERAIGVKLNQVDRITLVIPSAAGAAPEESVIVRVSTIAPYDRSAVLKMLGVGKSPLSTGAQLPASGGMMRFTDDKNMTFAYSRSRASMLLSRVERRVEAGRLAPALKLAAAEKHFLVAAIDMAQARQVPWVADDSTLRPFFIARTAVLVGDLKPTGLAVSLRLTAGLRGHAEEIAEAMETRRGEAVKRFAELLKLVNPKTEPARARLLEGIAEALRSARVERKDREVSAMAAMPSIEPLVFVAVDAVDAVQCAADRLISTNNLKQMALAMHNYHDTNNHFPAAVMGKDNKPLLSWRVAILPFIEEDGLFKQFKLDQPWDSEHNKKLLSKMPKIYALPGDRRKFDVPTSYYRVFVGNGAAFDLKHKTRMQDVTDGLSNTIMIVEAADGVPWTKPDEIEYDPKKPPKVGYHYAGRGNAAFCDGSVHTLRRSIDEQTLHWLIQRADGNPVFVPD